GRVKSVVFDPNGKSGIFGIGPNVLRWEFDAEKEKLLLEMPTTRLPCFACTETGKLLALAVEHEKNPTVWDVTAGKMMSTLKGASRSMSCEAFSRDGKLVATGTGNNEVELWHCSNGERAGYVKLSGQLTC